MALSKANKLVYEGTLKILWQFYVYIYCDSIYHIIVLCYIITIKYNYLISEQIAKALKKLREWIADKPPV